MTNQILAAMKIVISANTAEFTRAMNTMSGAVNKFATITGVTLGSAALFQGIRKGIGIMMQFEKTMSEVRAITGATGSEFKSLEADALRLGSSTKYTASQVGELQIAYGRLGFTTKEILQATEATLDLAAATGEDLAKSADVAGSTVRGFQLNASETQRVVDVMAASFNKTALGLENFTESMKYVAPVANAAGATVEETTALLGTLADAGIRGSMAGTSLRKIFTDMTKDGRPLKERLAELAAKGITLSDSFDEVGRTAQTSLLILSKNTEKTAELTQAFSDVNGEAAKMARIMQDNLQGDVTKLTSAWEGLILAMSNSGALRKVTQDLTGIFNSLSGTADVTDEMRILTQAIKEGLSGDLLKPFIDRLSEIRRELGKPIDTNMVQELAEKYKLTDAQANELFATLNEINKALSFQEKAIKQFNEFSERNGYKDMATALTDYKQKLYELILAEQISQEQMKQAPGLTDVLVKKSVEQVAAYRRVINILNEYSQSLQKVQDVITGKGISMDFAPIEGFPDPNPPTEFTGLDSFSDSPNQKVAFELSEERIDQLHRESLAVMDLGEDYINLGDILITEAEKVEEAMVDMSGIISGSIASLSAEMGRVAVEQGNFGDAILQSVANFAQAFGSALIAAGVGKIAFDKFSGPAMIAAGGLLVAAGAATAATINNRPDLSNHGNASGRYQASYGYSSGYSNRDFTFTFEKLGFDGSDLIYQVGRQEQLNRRTTG